MIREQLSEERKLVVTSDLWHVVHSAWIAAPDATSFTRTIVSEHRDRASAVAAGRRLKAELVRAEPRRTREERDQVIVRHPGAESFKHSGRVTRHGYLWSL